MTEDRRPRTSEAVVRHRSSVVFMSRRHPPPEALLKFLKPYDRAIQNLALGLRKVLLEEIAPCHENIYDAYSAVAIGYGTSERLADGIFHIAVYASGVNLGFNDGASLDDPRNVLLGTGKQIRHISCKSMSDLERPELREYIRLARNFALEDARKLGDAEPPAKRKAAKFPYGPPVEVNGVTSVVKAIYPKKRRPGKSTTRSAR
jgi:hypothetical protein